MPLVVEHVGRAGAGRVVAALTAWAAPGCYAAYLHAGDIGWQLRMDDRVVESSLLLLRDGSGVVAVAIADEPSVLRPAIRPDHIHDLALAERLADIADAPPGTAPAWAEAPSGSALRSVLSTRGWVPDPDPWAVLFKALTQADGQYADPLSRPLVTDQDVVDRVAVQRSAFAGSTFTVAKWRQMASGPGYDPSLDLLRRTEEGTAVAAATGWSAGSGTSGILEPVGTHRAHTGRGHGRAVSLAVVAALARAGSSGVTVHTPVSNEAAVRAYEACGLRQVEVTRAMLRPATA